MKYAKKFKGDVQMNVYEQITNKILDKIKEAEEKGKAFHWIKPWTGGARLPVSYTSQKPYTGINFVTLDAGEYITYKAFCDFKKTLSEEEAEKVHIKKGCHKVPIYYFGSMEKKDEDGNVIMEIKNGKKVPKLFWFMKYYTAFHMEDIEGLKSHYPAEKFDYTPDENMKILDNSILAYAKEEKLSIDIVEDGRRCFYSPSSHMVCVPQQSGFKSQYSYYSAILHELIHSTSKGLNRESGTFFGSQAYCKEELVAQLGSQMLLNYFGIVPEKEDEVMNDIAYIKGWADYLKDNKTEIVKAGCLAQNAVEYFISQVEKQLKIEKNIEIHREETR